MEENYSWNVLERKVPPLRRNINTSMKGENMPDLLVFKPKFMPDPDFLAKEFLSISSKTIDMIDGTYEGQCAKDKPHGNGFMTYKKSSDYFKFDGRWYNGKFLTGTLVYKNGDSFKGLFRDGRKFIGNMTYANGGDLLENKETRC